MRPFRLNQFILIADAACSLLLACGGGDGGSSDNGTTCYADTDGDGYGNASVTKVFDSAQAGWVLYSTDCDDTQLSINPGAAEICNRIDGNCDTVVDETGSADCVDFYLDNNADGFGLDGDTQCLCSGSGSYTASTAGDCNDSNAIVNPDAVDVCNGVDDDCSGTADQDYWSRARRRRRLTGKSGARIPPSWWPRTPAMQATSRGSAGSISRPPLTPAPTSVSPRSTHPGPV